MDDYEKGWRDAMEKVRDIAARASATAASEASSHRVSGVSDLLTIAAESRRAVWGCVVDFTDAYSKNPRLGRRPTVQDGKSLKAEVSDG